MPDPINIPEIFGPGVPLSAHQLNRLQSEILRQLYGHTHDGPESGPQIDTGGVVDMAITEPKLADGAVSARTIADGAVKANAFQAGAITAHAIDDNAIETRHIKDGAVSEEKLSDDLRALIRRRADNVSSASEVVWRDPLIVFPKPVDGPTIVETWRDPRSVPWEPPVIGIGRDDRIVGIRGGILAEVIDAPLVLPAIIEERRRDAIFEIQSVKAVSFQKTSAGTFSDNGGLPSARNVSAKKIQTLPTVNEMTESSLNFKTVVSSTGRAAAGRITTVNAIGQAGETVAYGAEKAQIISSGFVGKSSFLPDGETVDYSDLKNQADINRAAIGLKGTLYNLGIDADYVKTLEGIDSTLLTNLKQGIDGDAKFFRDDNTLWKGKSWLPTILENPQFFGTGYGISGGRNILEVIRDKNGADEVVTIKFITPYKNQAYAVSATPRLKSGFKLIAANIYAKRRDQCSIRFRGVTDNGDFVDVNSLSFDITVFGDIDTAEVT